MQHLRIAMYPTAGVAEALKHWNETVGAHLDQLDALETAVVADDGDNVVVVSRWESAEALERELSSEEYRQAMAALQERTGLNPADMEPAMLFMGPIVAHARGG